MITSEDFPSICRLCMSGGDGELQPLSQLTSLNLLITLIQIDINAENLPKNICNECIVQLDNIYKFIENCQNCNTILETLAVDSNIEVTNCHLETKNDNIKTHNPIQFEITEMLNSKLTTESTQREENTEVEDVFIELYSKFKCLECKEVCSTKRSLAAHMASHRKDHIYNCPICSATFPYAEYLTRHTLNTHGEKPFVCEICQEGFVRKRSLEEHKNFHSGATPYICSHCGQGFKIARHYNKHMYLVHNPNLLKIPKSKRKYIEKRVHLSLECKECGKIFASRSGFSNHQLIHKGLKKFLCSICGKQFLANAQLQKHLKCHNGNSKNFKCSECHKTFSKKESLLSHLSKMHTLEDMQDEELTTQTESLQCSYCNQTFSKKSNLQGHIQKHLNLYKCTICAKNFSYASHLNTHMRIHNGEKPYMCSVCGKLFSQKQTLTVHMRIHFGVTPFECSHCDKKYHDSTNLRRHIKRHHEKVD